MSDHINPAGGQSSAGQPAPTPPLRLAFDNSEGMGTVVLRHILNTALMIVTLGVYRFWAISTMRRILWWRTSLQGQRFEYTGDGLEIFLGFLKVFLMVLLPVGLAFAGVRFMLEMQAVASNLTLLQAIDSSYAVVVLLLIELGRFLSWRYRVSRTRWRGIRSRIDMPVRDYFGVAIGSAAMLVFSAWILKPVADVLRARTMINHLNIGGMRATLNLSLGKLVPVWLLFFGISAIAYIGLLVWVVITVGIGAVIEDMNTASETGLESLDAGVGLLAMIGVFAMPLIVWWGYCVYRAAFWRHVCANTQLGPLSFKFEGSVIGLLWLSVTNALIYSFSLTLLAPITWRRKVEYAARNLTIIGQLDPEILRQIKQDETSIGGEGLAGDFDLA